MSPFSSECVVCSTAPTHGFVNHTDQDQGFQKKIMPHLACLLARLLRCIHRDVSRYAPLDGPRRRPQIRRYLVGLFLTVTLTPKWAIINEWVDQRNGDKGPFIDGNKYAINMPIRVGFQKKRAYPGIKPIYCSNLTQFWQ